MDIIDGDSAQQTRADMTWQSYGYARQPRMVLRDGNLYPKTESDATIVRKILQDKRSGRIDPGTQLPIRFEDPDGEVIEDGGDFKVEILDGRIHRVR